MKLYTNYDDPLVALAVNDVLWTSTDTQMVRKKRKDFHAHMYKPAVSPKYYVQI